MSKVGLWSTTANTNTSAVPDGWPEGQLPSTLNDCAREMMAAIKTALQDIDYFDHGFSPTYINANSFSVPGNQTDRLLGGRQLKLFDGVNTTYRDISTASYTTVTTIQLVSGTAITASMSSFAVSILNPQHSILPPVMPKISARFNASTTGAIMLGSFNVASVSRSAAAVYRINFANNFSSNSYITLITFSTVGGFNGRFAGSVSATVSSYKFTIQTVTNTAYEAEATINFVAYGS
jgi:hypothetical protein